MILYVYNKQFVATCIIDSYRSLIWSERYCDVSEFELKLPPYFLMDHDIKKGYYIQSKNSNKLMIAEAFEVETDDDGIDSLIITGRSLESILDRRVVYRLTRFGVSDDPTVIPLPPAPDGWSIVKWAALQDDDETYQNGLYYETGITVSSTMSYSGKWARTGSQTKNRGYMMMGAYDGSSGFMLFEGSSLSYIDLGVGNPVKLIKFQDKLPYTSGDDEMDFAINVGGSSYLYSLNGETKTGSFQGSLPTSSQLYFWKTPTKYSDVIAGYRVAMVGGHEIQSGSYRYRFYPIVNNTSGEVNVARYYYENDMWKYDTTYGLNHLHGNGTLIAGPKEEFQAVPLYKAATALVDENFIHNLDADPYWGDMSKRNIEYLTCKNTDDYDDKMVTNWTITGSYYGEQVLDAIKDMLSDRNLGFRIEPIDDNINRWMFEVYSGKDRSYSQLLDGSPANEILEFSPVMANVGTLQYLESEASYKNTCFVMGENEILNQNATGRIKINVAQYMVATVRSCKVSIIFDDGKQTQTNVISLTVTTSGEKTGEYSNAFFKVKVNLDIHGSLTTVSTVRELMLGDDKVEAGTQIASYEDDTNVNHPWSQTYKYLLSQVQLSTRRCAFAYKNAELAGLDLREMKIENNIPSVYKTEEGDKVFSSDIYASLLKNAGFEELTNYRTEKSFSGEILTDYDGSQYKYKRDYDLGDVVEIADQYGNNARARITEMVFTSDENGEKWVPTIQTDNEDEQEE